MIWMVPELIEPDEVLTRVSEGNSSTEGTCGNDLRLLVTTAASQVALFATTSGSRKEAEMLILQRLSSPT